MGKSKTVSIKDTIVGNLIHGKNDVTCGGLLNEPLHKLSEKANKEYVETKLDELKAIDDVGGDIKYEEPLYYPSVLQKDKKIKYGDKCYQVQQDSNLFIDYSKLNVGEVSHNDLLGLFNETGLYVPDSIVDFFSGTMYSDGFNIILPKSKTEGEQNLYNLFDFETFIDDNSIIVTSCSLQCKTQTDFNGEYIFNIQVNDIVNGPQTFQVSTSSDLQEITIETDYGFRDLSVIIENVESSLMISSLRLNLVRRWLSEGDDEDFYVYKLYNLGIKDLLNASEDTRHKFYRNLIDEEVHFTERVESKNVWGKITTTNDLTDGEYLIICESKTPYNVFDGSKTSSLDKTDITALINNNEVLYVVKTDETPIDDLTTVCVYISKYYNSTDDKYYYNIKNASGDYYIGGTGKSKLSSGTTANYFKNDIQFVNGVCNIISRNYNGTDELKLQRNNNGQYFRFYTSVQSKISLFKHINVNPFLWKTIAKKENISKVGFTNNYNDLDNKPILGDVIINNYETLPSASIEYNNVIARVNNDLFTISLGNGWNFDPIRFSNEYNKVQQVSLEHLRDYFYKYLKRSQEHFTLKNFELSKLNTQNTVGKGLQFGTSSSYGFLKITMLEEDFNTHTYKFNSVTISAIPWSKSNGLSESGSLIVQIGWRDNFESEPIIKKEGIIVFNDNEEVTEKTITLSTVNECNYIHFKSDENSGRRIILNKFIYNDLRYWVSNEEIYYINECYNWNKIGDKKNLIVKNKTLFLM